MVVKDQGDRIIVGMWQISPSWIDIAGPYPQLQKSVVVRGHNERMQAIARPKDGN